MEVESYCKWRSPSAIGMISELIPPIELNTPIEIGVLETPDTVVLKGISTTSPDAAITTETVAVEEFKPGWWRFSIQLVVTTAAALDQRIPFEMRCAMDPNHGRKQEPAQREQHRRRFAVGRDLPAREALR